MAEKLRIEIDCPTVEFVLDGQVMGEFNYFDLEQTINDTQADVVKVKEWMHAHGLPDTVNLVAVDQWLIAYLRVNNDRLKKASGLSS